MAARNSGQHRTRASLRIALPVMAVLLVFPCYASGDPFLGQLTCVSLRAAYLEVGESFGITIENLRQALRTGVSTHLPGLKIDSSCPDGISYKVFLQNAANEPFKGFFGHVALEVTRKAIFRDTALLTTARAWDLESYVYGTRDKALASVLEQLDSHLKQLAADYDAAHKYK
jgi:hypothetical protein